MDHQGLLSGPAVASLVRRGISPSVLFNQQPLMPTQVPGASSIQPGVIPPTPPPMPDRSPMTQMANPQAQAQPMGQPNMPSQPGMPGQPMTPQTPKWSPQNEAEIIVNSLIKRLESFNKHAQLPSTSDHQEVNSFNNQADHLKNEYIHLLIPHGQ